VFCDGVVYVHNRYRGFINLVHVLYKRDIALCVSLCSGLVQFEVSLYKLSVALLFPYCHVIGSRIIKCSTVLRLLSYYCFVQMKCIVQ